MSSEENILSKRFFERMRVLMESAFGLQDLRTLCSDIEIDYENIAPETKTGKALGIIEACRRGRKLADLVDYCRRYRPDEDWPDPPDAIVVAVALGALTKMMEQDGELRDAVTHFKQSFAGANGRIKRVSFFKGLHDQLHILQVKCYDPLMGELKRVQEKGAQEIILNYVAAFKLIIDEINKISGGMTIESFDMSWIPKLSKSQILLAIGADPQNFDLSQIKKAVSATNNILSVHPSKINMRLIEAVGGLDLGALKKAMEDVTKQFSRFDLDAGKVEEFKAGINSLDDLNQRLKKLTDEHDLWQNADLALRRIEELMEIDIAELETGWSDLQSDVSAIYAKSGEEWAVRLALQSEKVTAALAETPKNESKIIQYFDSYRQQAGQRFFTVDTDLLRLCSELGEMGERLTPLLEKM